MSTNYFIIDGMNLAHRSHNANFEAQTGDGRPSGMIFGFLRTILSLKKKHRSYKFIVVWDHKPVHKYEINPEYKAGRIRLPSAVMKQLDDIQEFLKNCGVDQCDKEEQEADDVIATLVEDLKRGDAGTILVYSNDKDLLQLVEDGKVVVYKPKVGLSPEKFYDEGAVKEKFGVLPSELSSFRCFGGDTSDNLPGVARVPRKIIAQLVHTYGDPAQIYECLDQVELTDFQKRAFAEAKSNVLMNREIVPLNKNLENIRISKSVFTLDALIGILNKYEIKTVNPEVAVDLFSSALDVRYSDARPSYKLETFSLF